VNAIAPFSAPVTGPSLDNRRILAGLVDIVIVGAGTALLTVLIGLGGGSGWGPQLALVSLAWALYYYFALESGNGQTLGKKLMKLRVVRADGGSTGMREIAVRTALRIVDGMFLYLVGLVVMLVTGQRRQRLGDIAAGTMVVDAASAAAPAAAVPAVGSPPAGDAPATQAPAYSVSTPVDLGSPLPGMTAPELPSAPTFNPSSPEVARQSPQAPDYPSVEPVAEPAAEKPSFGHGVEKPVAEQSGEEPVAEQPAVEPVADYPSVEVVVEPAVEPVPDDPSVDVAPEPAVEPAIEPVVHDPPAHEPEVVAVSSDDDDDDQMTVKSVETVSAMDHIMGEGDDDSSPPAQGDGPAGS
jgi:uncharacterized RDD family membrane protein YckC